MKIETSFLRTKVARRVVALFFLCALLPSSILAVIAFRFVTDNLETAGRERLEEIGRLTEDALLERLVALETTLRILASDITVGTSELPAIGSDSTLIRRFTALAVQTNDGPVTALIGTPQVPVRLDERQLQYLASERALLVTDVASITQSVPPILMGVALAPVSHSSGILWAEIDAAYLMTGAELLPRDTDLCVFDAANRARYCSRPVGRQLPEQLMAEIASRPAGEADRGHFEWSSIVDGDHLSWYQSAPLRSWGVSPWVVVVSESKATVLAGMANFWKFFIRVVFLALLVVALLSYVQIRKSMEPLVKLREGTERIANRDFDTQVQVHSGDEFEDLATSFNAMTDTLRKQFSALTAINNIDRAVLAALSTETILDTILSGIRSVLASDAISVSLASANSDAPWKLVAMVSSGQEKVVRDIQISTAERNEFGANRDSLWLTGDSATRTYLDVSLFEGRGFQAFLALPIFTKDELSGVIALAYQQKPAFSGEDLVQARQLVDQVAVALSNTRLIEQLDALNVGALTALARTIDAKSSWTSGHSERVTQTSLLVGRELGLPDKELELIHRGGLLHDIGKIGVPAAVLDKPGKLTEDEWVLMKSHVTIGARILEPIEAYRDVIPIVLRHHEHWDGRGYPDGLVGEEIDFYARVLTVGDVYDAMSSARPYRARMPSADVIAIITKDSGTQFDPEVVKAFLAVKEQVRLESHKPVPPVYRPVVPVVSGS